MVYAKNQETKDRIIAGILKKGKDVTPETLMEEALLQNISYGYIRHGSDDSLHLILNGDLIYLDEEAEPIKTAGKYKKFEDPLSGVTELENEMDNDTEMILAGNLDLICLGSV